MPQPRQGRLLFIIILCVSICAWGQGSGQAARGAPPQQGAAAQQAGAQAGAQQASPAGAQRGQRGGTVGFYEYDATAQGGMPVPGKPAETHQKITINGEVLAYTAQAGFMPLRNATTGMSEAQIFFTSYVKEGVADPAARPLVFFFGGAPGVSAAWQEFGGLGPKRMKGLSVGTAAAPPYGWTDNPDTLLSAADLVFVNPVGTAWSRPESPARGANFWTTAGDIASLAEFVRIFLNSSDRRNSPVFLAGEDYGTGRVAGLAGYLFDHSIPVTGAILLSMTPSADSIAGDARHLTLLPSLALAAWAHKKLAPELQALGADALAEEARGFASREYLHALYKGDRMTAEERAKATASLMRLTGLPRLFIVSNDLRITLDRFNAELLRAERKALSSSDARVTGYVPPSGGGRGGFGGFTAPSVDYNQSYLAAGFQTAYEAYLKRELGFGGGPGIYYLAGSGIGTFTSAGNDDSSLSTAFVRNPGLRLFVGINYFDLNAPFYATEFTLAHLGVSPDVRARGITAGHYEAGQMAYIDGKTLPRLKTDLVQFVQDAASAARRQD
jgi:carboxypeptidase C (cathepsin A)